MGSTERRERHRVSLRREILDAASRLFVEEGYERLTMRRLAERIEYSPTTIYLHFRDKHELLAAVCDETFAELEARLERLVRAPAAPLGALRDALRMYVEFGLANPDPYTATFLRPLPPEKNEESARSAGARVVGLLRQCVQACVDGGDIRTADADLTAQSLWASVHGVTSLCLTKRDHPSAGRKALIDHTIDTLIAGLKTPVPAPRTPPQARSQPLDFMD
jgi:AcrR family transcriptional regulator